MQIHLIAIGGAVMHNLAIALRNQGHQVTGSDDEIFDPARTRLLQYGLLPEAEGWHPDRIHPGIDMVILGMHARKDNPELAKARQLGIPILSFPEFIYQQSVKKQRVVIAGSHGKTTISAMILHVLNGLDREFDYLAGSQIEGFESMVKLTDAPLIIIEGDEYLASALHPEPKFLFYKPHIAVITGIAWDHINVFPTFERYKNQFVRLLHAMEHGGTVFWYAQDTHLPEITGQAPEHIECIPYQAFPFRIENNRYVLHYNRQDYPLQIFGNHNMCNIAAAHAVCRKLGIPDDQFFLHIRTFRGAARRLEIVRADDDFVIIRDFAHAPSKVLASVEAVKSLYNSHKLVACLELHTYSSLNPAFLPQYRETLDKADAAAVLMDPAAASRKGLPPLSQEQIKAAFGREDLQVFYNPEALTQWLTTTAKPPSAVLLMTSGNFGGVKPEQFFIFKD